MQSGLCQEIACQCCVGKRDTVKKMLASNLLSEIAGYKLVDGQYKQERLSSKVIVEGVFSNPEYQIPLFRDAFNDRQNWSSEKLESIREYTKESLYNEIYCSHSPLAEYLQNLNDLLVLSDSVGNIYFHVKTTQHIKATEYPNFIETLIASDFRRFARDRKHILITNCIKPYDVLALRLGFAQEMPSDFHLTVSYLRQRVMSPDMIIPITESQLLALRCNPPSKDEFISSIMDSQQFNEIVKFTHEFQFQAKSHSLEEIFDCYKELISNVYDACIKLPCKKCGKHCKNK